MKDAVHPRTIVPTRTSRPATRAGGDVVCHDAEPGGTQALEGTDRPGLPDVEQAEAQNGGNQRQPAGIAHQEQRQQHAGAFIDNNELRVLDAIGARHCVGTINAKTNDKSDCDQMQMGWQQHQREMKGHRRQRADRARRLGRQPGAEPGGEPETGGRRSVGRGFHGSAPSGQTASAPSPPLER